MSGITIQTKVHFRRGRRSKKELRTGDGRQPVPVGRVPRVSRLMALAIRFDDLIHSGAVSDYAELARLGHVTRARLTQIMNLRMLAPDIQEEILHLPRVTSGRASVHLRQLQSIALVPDWRKQRRLWSELDRE